MIPLRVEIEQVLQSAFGRLGYDAAYARTVRSNRPDLCQFQCNGALAMAKKVGKAPREIAGDIVALLVDDTRFSRVEIAGPGFINMTLSDTYLASYGSQSAHEEPTWDSTGKTVVVDFAGPNVAKPMHVGHLRSAIIGDSLQRLFRTVGYNVISDNHLGDWGTQMGMLITELQRRMPELPYFDSLQTEGFPETPPLTIHELETMYPEASKACKEDPERMKEAVEATDELQRGRPGYLALWKHFVALSTETLHRDFSRLGVHFDHWLGESFYMDRMGRVVEELTRDGFVYESQGAQVMDVSRPDDSKEIPPVMLEKSGGGFLYATSDIATIEYRMKEFSPARICYVVDKRQALHFEQVFRAVRMAEIVSHTVSLEHVGFGTVNGKDGKPFKTREGGVMKLAELMDLVINRAAERMEESGIGRDASEEEKNEIARMVGIAALKFADLSNHRLSDYVFDIDKFSRFEGKTGPYILYSAVRIKSILRKVQAAGFSSGEILPFRHDSERDLLLELGRLGDVYEKAAEDCAPNYLCDYVYDLSQVFNRFYRDCHIMKEADTALRGSWISLCQWTLKTVEDVLSILGIVVPEKM
ncbi:arginine--tRNA ligase [Chitinivibrio alkaliphilus]|uniref:Arginine--tRNA ligase n=1 Tax=Chitinivibrio alkaliphilus ACht1 TaxID=1313304 RepID=U7DBJ9_9BACT|nr:arginine--tRNA ligase [Chitinivibrio alkaliphilus]ERP31805.1 arginyl-tRNA synthetase [Chitinivibrio alkaliphilus ACht1]